MDNLFRPRTFQKDEWNCLNISGWRIQSKSHKIHLKKLYWFHWGLGQVQRPAWKCNKLPAVVSNRKLSMRIFSLILHRYSFPFEKLKDISTDLIINFYFKSVPFGMYWLTKLSELSIIYVWFSSFCYFLKLVWVSLPRART